MADDVLLTIDNRETKSKNIILIKKRIKEAPPHHGGAWKVAYADFVTAMMAFFLLLWILSSSSPETKTGLVDYFQNPNPAATAKKGIGLSLKGTVPDDSESSYTSQSAQFNPSPVPTKQSSTSENNNETPDEKRSGSESQKNSVYQQIKQKLYQMEQSIIPNPENKTTPNIIIHPSSEGVRIDIVPKPNTKLFDGKQPAQSTKKILAVVGSSLAKIPYPIVVIISGTSIPAGEDQWTYTGLQSVFVRHWFEIGGLSSNNLVQTVALVDPATPTPAHKTQARISILIKVKKQQDIQNVR